MKKFYIVLRKRCCCCLKQRKHFKIIKSCFDSNGRLEEAECDVEECVQYTCSKQNLLLYFIKFIGKRWVRM